MPSAPAIPILGEDSAARVIDRLPLRKASYHIVNEKREAALLLRESSIVLQMTDDGLDRMNKEIKKTSESFLGRMLHAALAGAVTNMLDHGIEYDLRDLKNARVENGVLVLENNAGEKIFQEVNVNNQKVLETFSAANATAFAKRVNAAAAKVRK
jgi:hypothetical protein